MARSITWERLVGGAVPAAIGAFGLVWQGIIIVDAKHDRERLEATAAGLRAELAAARSSTSLPSSERNRYEAEIARLQDQLRREESELNEVRKKVPEKSGALAHPTGVAGEPASRQTFETEAYRLTVEDVKKSGKTIRVSMVLEAIGEEGLTFRAGEWYLLAGNGERWTELKRDPALVRQARRDGLQVPFSDGMHLVSGTKVKSSLVFEATGSGQGDSLTLIGVESYPRPRREIVLKGLAISADNK